MDFSLVGLHERTSEKPMGSYIKDSHELSLIYELPLRVTTEIKTEEA